MTTITAGRIGTVKKRLVLSNGYVLLPDTPFTVLARSIKEDGLFINVNNDVQFVPSQQLTYLMFV